MPKPSAAVTHKINTTIDLFYGVATISNTQLLLIDTPGYETAMRSKKISQLLRGAVASSDLVWHVVDARLSSGATTELSAGWQLLGKEKSAMLIVNKVDQLTDASAVTSATNACRQHYPYHSIIPYCTRRLKYKERLLHSV